MAKYDIKVIHESIFIIALCAVWFCIIRLYFGEQAADGLDFDKFIKGESILKYLLPMIILKEGFNLKKRAFFKNISHIICFGFFGTIINIIFLILGIHILNYYIFRETRLEMNFVHIMSLAIVLSNADTLAP